MKLKKYLILQAFLLVPLVLFAQNIKSELTPVRLEHLRLNVADIEATAKWYVENVDLEIIKSNSKDLIYLTDKDHNFLLELSEIPGKKNSYSDIDINAYHLAFEGQKSIKEVSEKMLANGAVQEGDLYTNKIGDYVMNVRDPNGFVVQLIHRVNPFFEQPEKSPVRFEHFAFNTPDQKAAALWYVEFMDLIIPWSKDIVKDNNNYRTYRVPYVGDAGNHMSLELFAKDIMSTLENQDHEVVHIGFLTDQPDALAKRMIYGGAKQSGKIRTEKNGDIIIDLYDPNGVPIRLIKRSKALLD